MWQAVNKNFDGGECSTGSPKSILQMTSFLAVIIFLIFAPLMAVAQESRPSIDRAMEILAEDLSDALKDVVVESVDNRIPTVFVGDVLDRDVGVSCQPLAEGLENALWHELDQELKRLGVRVSREKRQKFDTGNIVISLSYSRSDDLLRLGVRLIQITDDNGIDLGGISPVSIKIGDLSKEEKSCINKDQVFSPMQCTSTIQIRIMNSPGGLNTIYSIAPGEVFDVLASFDGEKALLVEYDRSAGVNSDGDRGFLTANLRDLGKKNIYSCDGLDQLLESRRRLKGGFQVHSQFADCDEGCPDMVVVGEGIFTMGSLSHETGRRSDELLQTEGVIEENFALGVWEISNAEWDLCVRDEECERRTIGDSGPNMPVTASFQDAQAYVSWLSALTNEAYRLPTEAEWEAAARAGAQSRYHWGDVMKQNLAVCRNCGQQEVRLHPQGSDSANKYGLYHMHGNMWEWVDRCFGGEQAGGSCEYRMLKGGSFRDDSMALRAANRNFGTVDAIADNLGFRVARDLN